MLEEGLSHRGMSDDGDADPTEGGEANHLENSLAQEEDGISEPYVGMEFNSEDAAGAYYDEYARLMSPGKVHYLRPRRHFAGAAKTTVDSFQGIGVGVVPSGVMYVSMDGNRLSTDANNHDVSRTPAEANRSGKNIGTPSYALRLVNRKRTLGRDAQNLLDYFKKMQAENPRFYAIQLDDDNCRVNVFWADARSRTAFMHFGDAVKLDTSYRVNQYRVPFAPFTGLNHHGQTILFGCALIFDDSEASFVWLLKTFLTAMNNHQSVSLVTDQDRTIQTAVSQVFPGVRLCINKRSVLREGSEKLAHIFHVHPNFQYELALENWFEKEIEADFNTICTTPVPQTPSPMEKQAADLYTRKIFTKFQEELVETFVYTANRIEGDGAISTFRVAKHVLTVFTVTNVLTLPPHYILKRWTQNAKPGVGTDEREDGAIVPETYNIAMGALKEGGKKVSVAKKNVAKLAPPDSLASGVACDVKKSSTSAPDAAPLLWPQQDEIMRHFNLDDTDTPAQSVSDLNLPCMAPVSLHRDDSNPDNMPILPCLKSMTWVMENKNSTLGSRLAVINLKLQDYSKSPSAEMEVKFQLSSVTLEPMLRSMAYISEQLSTSANRVAVINLKLQDTETSTGESEVKFQVSRDTLGAMLRSMAYIREQLLNVSEPQAEPSSKKHSK
ncbi:Protein FAR1-RELATED SEQUENCE 3 [Hibiscus syriacus]|uniref:Protein FAR1-RELATED SEQUENCE n=1 Tax=Hibiscus syriacus TaxID=106335 RepID=A0A6A2Z6N1_HIBSY|nr:Protein FAR1-RELATED SEQUENCE 3 [Hibiscus syriacus]